eukprot:CAMPEP_0175934664 /NCGR_PEP_ID=MMETSP0108-20121206/20614_1 /TAXON_ID=195067 ORGANISM="Goniomonas pacifica, Strain CCMP1869" /NCGR_SAMPLE_ID=MMETSP0108 /ASSEMBLY_ACC=CAM_ASM_000204 /LENGTH=75 /DNA_ID=CAMNT_0017258525 /DNA_START=245 /DNA_END=472 /DNA_ORIENTATION=+
MTTRHTAHITLFTLHATTLHSTQGTHRHVSVSHSPFSQKAGDTFAVRRISVCRVEEDAQEETKQALLEEFQDDEE